MRAVVVALGAALALLLARAARAYAPDYAPTTGVDPAGPLPQYPGIDDYDEWGYTMDEDSQAMSDPRVRAFLHTIQRAEHLAADVADGSAYRRGYGRKLFTSYDDHPILTGELLKAQLPPEMCRAAGFASGVCYSTAAGAYQAIVPTWNEIRAEEPRLPDFSPDSQDRFAVRLLRRTGALAALLRDDVDTALRLASPKWASLPYSTAQQNPRSLAHVLSVYESYLQGV